MPIQRAQVLKDENDVDIGDAGRQAPASTVHAVKLVVYKTEPVELLAKEELCCCMATD